MLKMFVDFLVNSAGSRLLISGEQGGHRVARFTPVFEILYNNIKNNNDNKSKG